MNTGDCTNAIFEKEVKFNKEFTPDCMLKRVSIIKLVDG